MLAFVVLVALFLYRNMFPKKQFNLATWKDVACDILVHGMGDRGELLAVNGKRGGLAVR